MIAKSLLLLLVPITMSYAASTDHAAFTARMAYPPGPSSAQTSPVFPGTHGQAYRFWLDPQRDVDGNLIVCELVMLGARNGWHRPNLLDQIGLLGYQKWVFAARDFTHGANRSIYGDLRTIDLPKLGLQVQIKVVRVAVNPTRATARMPAGYRFTDVTLEVRARRR